MIDNGLRANLLGAMLSIGAACAICADSLAATERPAPAATSASGAAHTTAPAPTPAIPSVAPAAASVAAPAAAPAQTAATPPHTAIPPLDPPMSAVQVIAVLDQTVDWYRALVLQQQSATEPSDLLILYDNRRAANKVMALAFDLARADAQMLGDAPQPAAQVSGDPANSAQSLLQFQQKLAAQGVAVQAEMDAERRNGTAPTKRAQGEGAAKLRELQGELDLVNTKKGIVATLISVTAGAGNSGTDALQAQIDAMAVANPAGTSATPATAATSGAPAAPATAPQAQPLLAASPPPTGRFGLWDLAEDVLHLTEKMGTIASLDQRTLELQTTLAQLRDPLIEQIKGLSARGDALAATADATDNATLNSVHDELDVLSARFKQASSLLLPLSQEDILLSQYRRNLGNWRELIKTQYRAALRTLGIRTGILLVILALLFAAAELWQRTVLRYIQDSRRRYQLLLLRRIALWSLVVVVIGFAFASELGSIATFAGLITAGIAVAMQSVLVSIVGYFFLIGKYGIRVGDRVQIGEVAGEVIDLGLVRMYLMELGAKGAMGPTGRVVAFANSLVFQVSGGLFKQIPGVNFSWREVVLNLPPGADYAAIKAQLLASMQTALSAYLPEILRQTKEIERTTLSPSAGDAQPQVRLHFAGSIVEAHVRYPVHLGHAAEIDEQVTEALARIMKAAEAAAAPAAAANPP